MVGETKIRENQKQKRQASKFVGLLMIESLVYTGGYQGSGDFEESVSNIENAPRWFSQLELVSL